MEKIKRITKKDNFNALLKIKEVKANPQLVEFINHEIELLNKKRTPSVDSKKAQEQEAIQNLILQGLSEIAEPVTISELQSKFAPLAEYSNQKISAYLTKLIDAKRVVNTKDKKKKKSYFSIVA